MVHFAETHDNLRLAAKSRTWARLRTDLCALFAPNGAFGFANGVEWFATEKLNVHDAPNLNWGASENQVDAIGRLSMLLKNHPAFHDRTDLVLAQKGPGNHVALVRRHNPTGKTLLILANLDDTKTVSATWDGNLFDPGASLIDLLTRETVSPVMSGEGPSCHLAPGQVLCLSRDPEDIESLRPRGEVPEGMVPRVVHQQLRVKALEIFSYCSVAMDAAAFDSDGDARQLHRDPKAYCRNRTHLKPQPGFIQWCWPQDLKREVMVRLLKLSIKEEHLCWLNLQPMLI
jgi:hypothetical protein